MKQKPNEFGNDGSLTTWMIERPRRNRRSQSIRLLVQETSLCPHNLVWPVFVSEQNVKTPISSMPGQYRFGVDGKDYLKAVENAMNSGIRAVVLFPQIENKLKTKDAKEAYNEKGLVPRAIRSLKKNFPDLCVISDVALDPYSFDGHDGLVEGSRIVNDPTLEVLAKQALVHAEAGVDYVAPSDMMDGRVRFIRQALDRRGFSETGIISYTAKYASCFYGPFRGALDSAPRSGDKKTYQMNPANLKESVREALLDVREGADVLLIKPALSNLDVIHTLSKRICLPLAAYQVSGEYSMIKLAAKQGLFSEEDAFLESLYSIRRAGASMIFSYAAPEVAEWLRRREQG